MQRFAKSILFASVEECEQAFYEALERGDLDALMELWLQDDDVCCVHPGGVRIVGYSAVRASWSSLLGSGGIAIRATGRRIFESSTMAVTNVIEEFVVPQGGTTQVVHVLASNSFVKLPTGWKMVMHFAAPVPEGHAVEVEAHSGTVH